MSKSALARKNYFARRAARRDEQNVFNKQNRLPLVSLKTMKKITPPAPKPKIVKIVENKQIEIAPAIVEQREAKVERQVLRAATKQIKKMATAKVKKTPFKYPKKVKITLNKVEPKKNKPTTKKTIKKTVAVAKTKIAPAKKSAPTSKLIKSNASKITKKELALMFKSAKKNDIIVVNKSQLAKNKKK